MVYLPMIKTSFSQCMEGQAFFAFHLAFSTQLTWIALAFRPVIYGSARVNEFIQLMAARPTEPTRERLCHESFGYFERSLCATMDISGTGTGTGSQHWQWDIVIAMAVRVRFQYFAYNFCPAGQKRHSATKSWTYSHTIWLPNKAAQDEDVFLPIVVVTFPFFPNPAFICFEVFPVPRLELPGQRQDTQQVHGAGQTRNLR